MLSSVVTLRGPRAPSCQGGYGDCSHSKGSGGIYPPSAAAHECGAGSGGMN